MPVCVAWNKVSTPHVANAKIQNHCNTFQYLLFADKITQTGKWNKNTNHLKKKDNIEHVGVLNNTLPDLK